MELHQESIQMLITLFDTETTGLTRNDALDAVSQPHCVQLSARIIDLQTRKHVQRVNLISKPDGWHVDQRATEVHGITTAYAQRVGISETQVACVLMSMLQASQAYVCHNAKFDRKISQIMFKRYGLDVNVFDRLREICTMEASTDIVRCPPTPKMIRSGRTHYKAPKLQEAHVHFFGYEFSGAHDADADSDATERVFWHLYNMGVLKL